MSRWKLAHDLQDLALRHMADVRVKGPSREFIFPSEQARNDFLEAALDHPNSPYKDVPYSLVDNTFGYSICVLCHGPLTNNGSSRTTKTDTCDACFTEDAWERL